MVVERDFLKIIILVFRLVALKMSYSFWEMCIG